MIDYDRLLVLDKGELVEFDTPWNLIRKEGGIFRNMCLKSGNFAELEAIARAIPVPEAPRRFKDAIHEAVQRISRQMVECNSQTRSLQLSSGFMAL